MQTLINMQQHEALHSLWAECFPHKAEQMREKPQLNQETFYTSQADGLVVAGLRCKTFRMKYNTLRFNGILLSDIATRAGYREQGLATELIARAVTEAHARGAVFAVISRPPANLNRFFTHKGFRVAFYEREVELTTSPGAGRLVRYHIEEVTEASPDFCKAYHAAEIRSAAFAVLRSPQQIVELVAQWTRHDGKVLVCRKQTHIDTLLFVQADHEARVCHVYDLPRERTEGLRVLLAHAAQLYPGYRLVGHASHGTALKPCGRARVVNVEKALTLFARRFPDRTLNIRIYGDHIIAGNNGFFRISNGLCSRLKTTPARYLNTTISGLVRILIPDGESHMSRLID